MNMCIIVRFYWQHDLDLIALAHDPSIKMGTLIKEALTAYVHKTDFSIAPPHKPESPIKLDTYSTHFLLNLEKDADVIDYLNHVREGYRNSVIKHILRSYFPKPVIEEVYFNNEFYQTKSRVKSNGEKISTQKSITADNHPILPQSQPVKSKPLKSKAEKKEIPKPEKQENISSKIPVYDEDTNDFDLFAAIDHLLN